MDILVCVKHVPATDTRVKVDADGVHLDPSDVNFIINPFDEFAVEEALQWKEAGNAETVSAVSVGGEEVLKTLKHCLAMGADSAIHIDTGDADLDPFATASLLAALVKEKNPSVVFAGKQAVGSDHGLVPGMMAELAGWPSASVVVKIERDGDKVTCHCEVEGGEELVTFSLPGVISCQKGLNDPRYPSLKGIMKAKRKPVEAKTPGDLGLDMGNLSGAGAKSSVRSMSLPAQRAEGKLIEGEAAAQAQELVRLLREEAKVI